MIKEFLFRKFLKNQMRGVPEREQEKVLAAITKNPDFFKSIAEEIQKKISGGKTQMDATMDVVNARRDEIQKMMEA